MKFRVSAVAICLATMALRIQADVITPTPHGDVSANAGAEWAVKAAPEAQPSANETRADSLAPEPTTLCLIGAGLTTIGLLRRRSRKP